MDALYITERLRPKLDGVTSYGNILQLHYVDESVDPCENFYDFACGNFEKYHPLPQERDVWDNFYILQNQTHELVKKILEKSIQEHDSTSLQKAKTAYAACMDLDYIDQQLNPQDIELVRKLKGWPLVEDIENEKVNFTVEDIAKITSEYGVEFLFNFQVIPNIFDSFENVLYITGDKVSAPENFKSNMESIGGNIMQLPFEKFLINVAEKHRNAIFSLKSPEKILKEIHEVVDFIETLEKGGYSNDSYGVSAVIETIESLQKWTNTYFGHTLQLNWLNYINIIVNNTGTIATNSTKIMLGSRSSLYGILKLVEKTPPYILKNFVITRLLLVMAPEGNEELRYYFEQLYKEKKWTLYKRPEYCVQKLLNYPNGIGLSYALLMPYYATIFNTRNIEMIKKVIENLFETFIELLYESDWLDERTRNVVIEKANEMDLLLAFPESIRNETFVESYYKNLQISLYDHFGNSQKLRAFNFAQKLSQMLKPRDRKLWTMSPLEANAFYTTQSNRIQLPLAILNPIFFNGVIQPLDYGRLGMVIGHEIIHGFDSQGRLYDKYGSYEGNWWSPNATHFFSDKQNCFINQYGKYYIPEISQNVSSVRTVRENIADNGGLRMAYRAFKNLPTPFNLKYDKYTMEQLFFIGFGTMWCSKEDTQHLKSNNAQGTYVTNRFRVIGPVSNMEEFGEAFNCPLGSTMNPKNKCILW